MNITAKMPTDQCDECGQMKPAFGFTHLTSEAGGVGRKLCSECCNREYMLRAGLPELETVDFEPLSCRDCAGKKHIFYFVVHMSTGLGIKAFELVDGAPGGYQFFVLEPPQTAVRKAHDKLVKKIEAGLAVQYLRSSDFPGSGARQNRLYVKGTAVNGRIDESDDGSPVVVVDGRQYSWEEFGQFLTPFNGFNFRLECFDTCDNPDIASESKRPNLVWWLQLPEAEQDDEDHRHH